MEDMCSTMKKYEINLSNINENIKLLLEERCLMHNELSLVKSMYSKILDKLNHTSSMPRMLSTNVNDSNLCSNKPSSLSYSQASLSYSQAVTVE